ncbi:MAG: ATP-grasp domain-containing protein [Archaeoglobaceae archaeon]|nr:ATP-grasp domain-containing protein [Archaeoglobaceae archaeon]MCX8152254.1 ATP-grasp domain-containing protein [Archaeoglobaceae archaeon]MDW8013932.1 ATP-grasp domain-containing protein [Archaeoglobaceae archaeon]
MSKKVLVVGSNVRNVASSARRAGYEVLAVARFVDSDLKIYCKEVHRFSSLKEAKEIAEELAERENAKVILTSSCETLKVKAELLCNDPKVSEKVCDKLNFYRTLEKAGIPYPELGDFGENTIMKPRIGGGGEEVRLGNEDRNGFIKQRFIDGIPCSVSLIVGREITPIAVNKMIVGWKELNAKGFRYAGNITPLDVSNEVRKEIEKIAIETVSLFDLLGSVGVDFILAEKPYVLEINPRFQGSLDTVEWSCDVNLFKMHVMAFEGKKVEKPKLKRVAIRAILFSPERVKVLDDLSGNPFYADIPNRGDVYEKDDPLVSILATKLEEVIRRKEIFMKYLSPIKQNL